MKILYGVQGTGNGHITRARMMANAFAAKTDRNIDVTFLFSGRPRQDYFDMQCFADCLYRTGLTFVTEAGKINHLKSALFNNPIGFIREVSNLDVSPYDLIITDFEPVTAWAGKLSGKTVVGLGHQYAFGHNIPLAGYSLLASLIMRYFAPSTLSLGLHWHHFGHSILPPIIDNSHQRSECQQSIMVYLPFEDQDHVCALLNSLPDYQFTQYSSALTDQQKGNVAQRKACHEGFKQDLAASQAVICNAGFELLSECLNMGLPILAKPVKGQFEQQSNAAALLQLGYGQAIYSLDREPIARWLGEHKTPPTVRYNDTAAAVVNWLLASDTALKQHSVEALVRQLWLPVGSTTPQHAVLKSPA
jgi:uncharacterized protein (TIGR00661 family)